MALDGIVSDSVVLSQGRGNTGVVSGVVSPEGGDSFARGNVGTVSDITGIQALKVARGNAGVVGSILSGDRIITTKPALVGSRSGLFKVRIGASWQQKPAKVWNGSSWVAKPVKVWSGSEWVTAL